LALGLVLLDFVLAIVVVCLAGGYFYRQLGGRSFAALFAALLMVASGRQEGFLFRLFGVALVIRMFWGDWRRFRVFVPLALVLTLGIAKLTKTNQGGFMLLTSLIHLAPDRLWFEPDLSSRVVELRENFKPQWPAYPDHHNISRKIIVGKVDEYLVLEKPLSDKVLALRRDAFTKRLALEIAARIFRQTTLAADAALPGVRHLPHGQPPLPLPAEFRALASPGRFLLPRFRRSLHPATLQLEVRAGSGARSSPFCG
jgi:hypothetical protein